VTLHAFNAHGRAVTGLSLHPRPGLLITAGMDGFIKVFDLEAFTQVQSIDTGDGITHFCMGTYIGSPMCVVAQVSGDLIMWKIGSCCTEFSACSSNILKLSPFQNMNEYYSMHMSQICYAEGDMLGSNIGFEQ
jgi:WD40 repeat protein